MIHDVGYFYSLKDQEMTDDVGYFYSLKDQEMTDDVGYFYSLRNQEMIDDVWRIFLQPGMGYVDTKYVTFQCKITSVLNLHFISLKL